MRVSIHRPGLASLLVAVSVVSFGVAGVLRAQEAGEHAVAAEQMSEQHTAGESSTPDGTGHDAAGDADASHNGAGHESADHAGAAHGEHDYNKVPLIFEPGLFVWSLVVFLLFVFVAKRLAWVPLITGLDAREGRVNQALHNAEAARLEAEKLLADHDARMARVHEEVKEILAATRREAEAEKARIIAAADKEAAAMRDQAIADIRTARQQALDDLHSQIDRQVAVATEHVLGHAG